MEIILIVFGVIVLLCLLSVGGWILKLLEGILGLFFEGIGNCFGCLLKFAVWIFAIILIIMMLAA